MSNYKTHTYTEWHDVQALSTIQTHDPSVGVIKACAATVTGKYYLFMFLINFLYSVPL